MCVRVCVCLRERERQTANQRKQVLLKVCAEVSVFVCFLLACVNKGQCNMDSASVFVPLRIFYN